MHRHTKLSLLTIAIAMAGSAVYVARRYGKRRLGNRLG